IQTHRGGQLFQWLANNGYGRTNQERSDMIMFILDALSKDGYIVPNPDKGTARNKPDWVIR
ncbi:MAG TPA: hypothetical protein PLN94_11465, partial [Thiolinea sp.]|nr:hypothetical protein [Thiolinea sp.]